MVYLPIFPAGTTIPAETELTSEAAERMLTIGEEQTTFEIRITRDNGTGMYKEVWKSPEQRFGAACPHRSKMDPLWFCWWDPL